MSINISNANPTSTADGGARGTAPAPTNDNLLSATPSPAATIEISDDARQAFSAGKGYAPVYGSRPLNIIWGNGPR